MFFTIMRFLDAFTLQDGDFRSPPVGNIVKSTSTIVVNKLPKINLAKFKKNKVLEGGALNIIMLKCYCLGRCFVYPVNEDTPMLEIVNYFKNKIVDVLGVENDEYYFTVNNKPLNINVSVKEHNIHQGDVLLCQIKLKGGSKQLPPFKHNESYNVTLEKFLLKEKKYNKYSKFELQSEDLLKIETIYKEILHVLLQQKSLMNDKITLRIYDILENFFMIVYRYHKCDTYFDYVQCTMMGYKLLTGQSLVIKGFKMISFLKDELQSDDTMKFRETLKKTREMFTLTTDFLNCSIVKNLKTLYTYLLMQGILTKMGYKMSEDEFRILERSCNKKYKSPVNMMVCIIDTVLIMCEKYMEYKITGEVRTFIHDDVTYAKWIEQAEKLIRLSAFTSNLSAHGTSYFTFISDLNDTIEKGEAIVKFVKSNTGSETNVFRSRLQTLQMIKTVEVTKRSTQKERKAPFGVLIYGSSSVAKSSFTKLLFYYYAKLHDLDNEDHFRYVRNPADEYWSNFDTSKWCIQLDDIAFLLPQKTSDVDPTLKELLNVVNNVPYVPPQAALEDKGKTPVVAKLVLATSNAADLNASSYFWCPLAVRRRLPYVVNIKPKPEYLHENRRFINPAALPEVTDSFPDFWEITVQKLVPEIRAGRDWAKLETVAVYTDINEFLINFGQASMQHEYFQDKSDKCDTHMKQIQVCKLCCAQKQNCKCLQAHDFSYGAMLMEFIIRIYVQIVSGFLYLFIINRSVYRFTHYIVRYRIFKYIIAYLLTYCENKVQVSVLGRLNSIQYSNRFKYVLMGLTTVSVALSLLFVGINYQKSDKERKKNTDNKYELQGNKYSTTEDDLNVEDSQNVWYNPTIELNRFDLPLPSSSLSLCSMEEVRDLFQHNVVRLFMKSSDDKHKCYTSGVYVTGQYLMFNSHSLFNGDDTSKSLTGEYEITIINAPCSQGLQSNHVFNCFINDIYVDRKYDIAIIKVTSAPPRRDLLKFWGDKQVPITLGMYLIRDKSGYLSIKQVYNMKYNEHFPVNGMNREMNIYLGTVSLPTSKGDCGSPFIAMTPQGPVILGMHQLGYENHVGCVFIQKSVIQNILFSLQDDNIVSSGTEPKLFLNENVSLVEPHYKSLFRYIETGTARIYGSFPGFRPKPKSTVCATPLQDKMLDHFKCTIQHDKPVMHGWEPWRKNIIEMVNPVVNYNRSILKLCVEGFTNDILQGLPSGWEKELIFLSKIASVNGLPGVKFIDRVNVNSSMGHPWCSSKKKFLISEASDKYPEGINFPDEIWERYDKIIENYQNGERSYPVFTGHLKDEPTTLKKIEAQKTRMFTGAPIDWSLVVRSRLLSFVRLLQKNKFVFEAGPGTVCQSKEWTDIYKYLVHFGKDQMIAGDYGKFDKHMIADFILAAFDIIINIYTQAGFEDNELLQIKCIAYDTAFPLVNVNGDLVEFYGTNPSGHPLTVIINSLVNSLYMRYAYVMLNPAKEVDSFKQNVHLFTYGDDNIMGVSENTPWFNHTTIQEQLDKIGVEYTMADKESKSLPYIDIDECSFLKRRWRYEPELGLYTCPLEEASIHKSLTVWIPSKTIDKYAQMVAVITSANNEYFFYGREIFEKHHSFFKNILELEPYKFYVNESTLPNWENLCERFRMASD